MTTSGGIDNGMDKGVRILSLDSGGPGTYSQLLIIREYTVRLANDLGVDEADVYPADYFDLMGGVGFGGLVAILLGHLRMNVDEATATLMDAASAIFPDDGRPNSDLATNTRLLRERVENILENRGIPIGQKMQEKLEGPIGCKVALYAATTTNLSHPVVLRNYKPRGSSLNPTIVEAICATMATPSYFSPVKIGPPRLQKSFVGGPSGANNPTRELLKEAAAIFGKERLTSQILSIGCGRSHASSLEIHTDNEGARRPAQELAADCEMVDKELSARLCDMDAYLRLNVDRGMENLLMNEWHDLGPIETHTSVYFEPPIISEILEASLRRLQGNVGTVTLGQINHPSAAKDVQNLGKNEESFEGAFKSLRDSEDSRHLDRLKPVDTPSYHEDRSCMKDTRKLILDDIVAWAEHSIGENHPPNDANPHNVFWLYGSPGIGKTSVANSLCHRFHKSGKLGGSLFARRDDPILRDPNRVLPTLIYRLAWMWSPYRNLIVQALREDPNLNPDWTGCELFLDHLRSLQEHPPTPLVLVIDALDECGEPQTRKTLLKGLLEFFSSTDWLRFIVISRPEHDIGCLFEKIGVVGHDLATDTQAHQDIRVFTRNRMASLANEYHLEAGWPGETRVEEIATRSGGLFIFVDTLYRFLDDPDPELLLTQVLCGTLEEAYTELHKLYSTAIESRIGRNSAHFRLFIQAIVAVTTHRSLPDGTVASLTGLEHRVTSSWVDKLSSLLYRDMSQNGGIRPRHLSILEFLVGPTCPPDFRVDMKLANSELARYCLVTMANKLQFNICNLETSYLSNTEIQDLNDRVAHRIPDALQYSCVHWSSHLCYDTDPVSAEITRLLDSFFAESQPLYWIEVLSLMGKAPVTISTLRLMKSCFKKFEDRHQNLVEDVFRFVLAFFTPISASAPHIYLSALPFTPTESEVRKRASISFSEILNVFKGGMESWPAPSGVWLGHTGVVLCVAYSPDGQNVVSGSDDNTIRIWDAKTGEAVGQPLTGHTGPVHSVAYSPDGHSIVSGSEDSTVRFWDAQTGALVGHPLTGHTGPVHSVAYSPDGRNIVSGSDDSIIRVWDAQTGEAAGPPLTGHTGPVWSVAYSPDGRSIASGSGDTTVRIWDAQIGEMIGHPFAGHTANVWNVAYSPDGHNVISCSEDTTVRIWDIQAGVAVEQPFVEHTRGVLSAAYSPDGRNIASGSLDRTMRIWDARTRAVTGPPLRGHSKGLRSVTYSPDGRNIVSGSTDGTIRIWDAGTGAAVGRLPTGHSGDIWTVAYSPDGRHVVSGAGDATVRFWDAQTGGAVGQPLLGHTDTIESVAYSPDGRNIASGSFDGIIRIWDVQTGTAAGQPLVGHLGSIRSVAYSPDGRNIISGSTDCTIRAWDARTGVGVGGPLIGHANCINSVAYSPDSRSVVSGSDDGTIRIWDAQTGAAVGQPLVGHVGSVRSVAYSPDGWNVVSGSDDCTIRIWDVQTGAAVGQPLVGHTGGVRSVAYSPDGRNFVSCSIDRTVRVWNAQTGTALGQPLSGHTEPIIKVEYSPDGQKIVSASLDRTIRLWDARHAMEEDVHSVISHSINPPNNPLSLTAFSGRPIPMHLLEANGWVRGPEGLLFWVPEDCRHGLICPAIMTIPHTGRQRSVRIDFSHFQYGTSWTRIRGESQ